jgi:hypothetical protein
MVKELKGFIFSAVDGGAVSVSPGYCSYVLSVMAGSFSSFLSPADGVGEAVASEAAR